MTLIVQRYDMISLRQWLCALTLTGLAIVISFYWFDRRIALFVHNQLPHGTRKVAEPLTYIPDPLIWIAAIIFVVLGLVGLKGRSLSKMQSVLLVCSVSLIVAETIKNELKFVFGRTWPETWYQNNPSFISNGVYGFNWFHGGQAYASFPSGHMTAICAVVSIFWIYYPQLRLVYSIIALGVLVTLVGADFHFLSDCIAGSFLGMSIGLITSNLPASLQRWQQGIS
jgi:membrane-associated phospholipid phosphatase